MKKLNKKANKTEANLVEELIKIVDQDGGQVEVVVQHEDTKKRYHVVVFACEVKGE